MSIQNITFEIMTLLQTYVDNKICGSELVQKYDTLISGDGIDWDSLDPKLNLIDQFQDVLAFYVENPEWRKEHNSYYGDLELTQKVKEFIPKLK